MPIPAAAPLALIDALLRGALLAALLLLAAKLWRERLGPRARTAIWLPLGVTVQTVGSMPAIEWQLRPLLQAPLVGVAVGNALLFWLFVKTLFDDEFRPRPLHALAWAAAVLLGLFNAGYVAETQAEAIAPWSFGVQRVLPLACALLALWEATRHWQADLVEPRRRLRGFIVGLGAFYTVLQVALRVAGRGRLEPDAALLDTSVMLLLVGTIAWRMLRLAPSTLFPADAAAGAPSQLPPAPAAQPQAPSDANPEQPTVADPADDRLAEALQRAMQAERAYRDEGLSVATLARRLGVPEYRLRRVINQRLGHRNFNAYINGFRLADATAALADPAQRELPVLTIALGAGFQSIGPFNRAFKAATGLTPTEFRQQHRADSGNRPAESHLRRFRRDAAARPGHRAATGGALPPMRSPTMFNSFPLIRRLTAATCSLAVGLAASLACGQAAAMATTTLPASEASGPVTLFYASDAAEQPLDLGPRLAVSAARDAAPRAGGNGRLVVVSHGSGGSPWVHADLARALVEAGFVVAVPEHQGDSWRDVSRRGPESWKQRPAEVSRAIDAVAADARFAPMLQFDRVGVYGMSAGGHTALSLAGGRWSPARFRDHCLANMADDFPACVGLLLQLTGGTFDDFKIRLARWVLRAKFGDETLHAHDEPRVAAVVAAVPVAADFDPASLAQPRVPLALLSAGGDRWLKPQFHSSRVLRACAACLHLADLPDAGHGAYLSPLPSGFSGAEATLLNDPPGFDRSLLAGVDQRIVGFFRAQLLGSAPPQ